MEHRPSRHTWIVPWVAPLALGSLYTAELLREGAASEPIGLAVQLVLGAPLVVSASVLCAVVDQEARTGELTPKLHRWLHWTPRVLLLLFVAVLALLSLDVFEEGRTAGEIALGLLLHNLPALALLAATAAAWRRPLVGALALTGFAVWWFALFAVGGFAPSVVLLMAVLPLTVAALFLTSWLFPQPRGLSSRADGGQAFGSGA
ncbi:MAG TPA: hypothetical protein VFC93_12060 [Chloroflexota bacterium]|nr:hypothetical protein [Chloroflexota bacterium]